LVLIAAATAALQFLTPFYMERELGQDPTTTDVVVLAFPAAMALSGLLAGALADRVAARPGPGDRLVRGGGGDCCFGRTQ
jgi:hypothetical protein